MNLTHPQLATVRRVIEEMAQRDQSADPVHDLVGADAPSVAAFLSWFRDMAIIVTDMAVHQEFGIRIAALSREQADLLKYVYIGRRIALQIEALEDRPVELRAEG